VHRRGTGHLDRRRKPPALAARGSTVNGLRRTRRRLPNVAVA
jgi:hypothetical protein